MTLKNYVFNAYLWMMSIYVSIWLVFVISRPNQDYYLTIALIIVLILLSSAKKLIKSKQYIIKILRDYHLSLVTQDRVDELTSKFDLLTGSYNLTTEKESKTNEQTETIKLINDSQNYKPFYADLIQNQIIEPLITELTLIDKNDKSKNEDKKGQLTIIADSIRDIASYFIIGDPIIAREDNINIADYLGITQASLIIRNAARRIQIIYDLDKRLLSLKVIDIIKCFIPTLLRDSELEKIYQCSSLHKAKEIGIKINKGEMAKDIINYIDTIIDKYIGVPPKIKRDSNKRRYIKSIIQKRQ